jgi:hypothetical protein
MTALRISLVAALVCATLPLFGQQSPIRDGAEEIAVWAGGGTGLGHSSSAQFTNVGVVVGRVLTGEHGPGWLRGDFEYDVQAMPLFLVFQDQGVPENGTIVTRRQTVFGGAVTPVLWKWNFTRNRRVTPFATIEGSALFTAREVPAGDTSMVNFQSGLGSGVQFFRSAGHSVSLSGNFLHISNASLGNKNPSYNVTLQFRLAYQWWR